MNLSLFTISLVLFLIMDPIGNIAPFLRMMKPVDDKRYTFVLVREMVIALGIMLTFNYIGEYIFHFLELSETTVRISSGVILFIVALQILFSKISGIRDQVTEEEPFIVPLALPLIAGPSLLATVMLYAHMVEGLSTMLGAILIAWFAALLVLFFARPLHRLLGTNGLMGAEKLMGMVLILLAVQRFLDGVALFMQT